MQMNSPISHVFEKHIISYFSRIFFFKQLTKMKGTLYNAISPQSFHTWKKGHHHFPSFQNIKSLVQTL